ncbi:MAG: preprotein translocase subunit SecA [Thermomicrobiales bacterium]|jgi:preprotein translocase subunit SecA|nr:preprotein translocase subunit SecA [Thermomicrobiales bacterium]MEA2523751.1 preprotein translocase subunit SecA [Thermomicrobiales bacterium]MEA2596248.1 preprotein translocase subunit SecA [Thermomicrobiales bacterium]
MRTLLTKILGDPNEKAIKQLQPLVQQVNELEPAMKQKSDEELRTLAEKFRARYEGGESLDDLLPEAFAATREAAGRTLGQRHYDVQLMGGMVLHQGKIAEMKTGEGKTLTATLAVALNAMNGRGVHVVTVNDYLAKRDTQWMGQVYDALGLTVGCIQHERAFIFDPTWESPEPNLERLREVARREAYAADITYGTNNEFGFDYLRDNMVVSIEQCVQRDLVYAIVDEVDNILIDEARTPLIISGQAERANDRYYQFAQIVKQLREGRHYAVDLKHKSATLTEEGVDKVEELAAIPAGESIYDDRYIDLTHYLENALKAEAVFHRDKDYIVRDGEVIIVDEFTGRMMPGRRWSEGLHQAVEAKENVKVRRQNVTMATITFQNYFRMYDKLAGMTGTAKTEAEEFLRIYNLDVVAVPTHRPMVRDDSPDLVFKNERGKFNAVIEEIVAMTSKGRPVLVGTTSVDTSERLSEALKQRGIDHDVLNAKQHEREAAIVAGAGQPGTVTIATNMAGRGTDIVLGPGVPEAGGLHIIGTERHESRRIDNQLRGRAGRQGDPGSSRFYVSLEDELMRRFGSERIAGLMERLGMEEEVPIEHRIISKSIESAQTKVEGHNFDMRRHVVQYDDVMNKHRERIYDDRKKIVAGEDMSEQVADMISAELEAIVDIHTGQRGEDIDFAAIAEAYTAMIPNGQIEVADLEGLDREGILDALETDADRAYAEVESRFGAEAMRQVERHIMLAVIDRLWVEHLTAMDDLREGVGLQAYGQRDPLIVYKTEGYKMFQRLLGNIQHDVVHTMFRVQPAVAQQPIRTRVTEEVTTNRGDNGASAPTKKRKVGVNELCPCGSGKKYKHCHGRVASKSLV